ncbi:hypothetical protein ACFQT0_10425 [Hymenobacter humi]|uniref:DUF4398 domain-containing protein n=1 Tax=Hymenobacter humi TaxID=1411620 RepID=A0ABW2U302_9BACT
MKNLSPALLALSLLAAPVLNSCVTAKKYDDLSARQKADAEGKASAERQYRGATAELQKASDELAQPAPHPKAPRDRLGRNRCRLPQNPHPLQRAQQQLRQAAQEQ